MESLRLPAAAAVLAALSVGLIYLFVRNILRSKATGEIYLQRTLVRRAESPAMLRFTVGLYMILTAVAVALAGFTVFAFIVFVLGV